MGVCPQMSVYSWILGICRLSVPRWGSFRVTLKSRREADCSSCLGVGLGQGWGCGVGEPTLPAALPVSPYTPSPWGSYSPLEAGAAVFTCFMDAEPEEIMLTQDDTFVFFKFFSVVDYLEKPCHHYRYLNMPRLCLYKCELSHSQ